MSEKSERFSTLLDEIFPLLTQATDQEMKRRNLQPKNDETEKEIVAKIKREAETAKEEKETDWQTTELKNWQTRHAR